MVFSTRLFASGLLFMLSVYDTKARSVIESSKKDFLIQVNIYLEIENKDYNPDIEHIVTILPSIKPVRLLPSKHNSSKPPTTTPSSQPSPEINSSLSTPRPFGWQPDDCDRYPINSRSLPKNGKKADFKAGLPITEEEIQAALLSTAVPNLSVKLPCSTEFLQTNFSSRGVVNPNWPNAEIPYELDSDFSEIERQMIIKAMEEITNKTCITFPPWNNHTNWLRIASGTTGCYTTSVGIMGLVPPVEISLQSNQPNGCFHHGIIVHEMLHAAGLNHEQTRRDRDNYVTILWENIDEGRATQFCKRNTLDTGHPYDYASIMHYSQYTFSIERNVSKTIDAKGNTIGQRKAMSQGDVDQLNYLYCNQTQLCKTEWKLANHHSSRRYCFVEDAMTWFSAYAHCERFGPGAKPAILDTDAKRNQVAAYMRVNKAPYAWVGASDRSGTYQWLHGNPVTNDSWYYGTPGPIPGGDGNTCVITSPYNSPKTLFSYTCSGFIFPVICEY